MGKLLDMIYENPDVARVLYQEYCYQSKEAVPLVLVVLVVLTCRMELLLIGMQVLGTRTFLAPVASSGHKKSEVATI